MSEAFRDPTSRALPAAGARVLVVGLGASGESAARRLLSLGAQVTVVDDADDPSLRERAGRLAGAQVRLGQLDPEDVEEAELVVASPGAPPWSPVLRAAAEAGVPIWGEVELAYRAAGAPVLGVTGTNGKTTTTSMLAAALSRAGMRAVAAGNIGLPLCDAVAGDAGVIVAELSSFQLHSIVSFRPPIAILLNVADDHLDWHGSFEEYGRAKARIFENQVEDDTAVVHVDARAWLGNPRPRAVAFSARRPAPGDAGVDDGWIVVPQGRVLEAARLRARGRPNLENAIAAAAAAAAFGADLGATGDALAEFEPAAHRMEPVAEIGGVSYVNDSKATNPHATVAALLGFERAVLIAGGRNKGLDLRAIAAAADRVRAAVAIGEAAGEIEDALRDSGVPVERAGSMDEAVERAAALARPGDTVLLSPACASFDMYADYRTRGEAFRAAVKRLEAAGRERGNPT